MCSVTNEQLDSLVSSQVYEVVKTIYDTTSDATPNPISSESIDSAPRIKVLQSTLGQLRLNNIATLDALTTHFTRLMDLTSADEEYTAALAQVLAPCVLRPRAVNALTMEERHPYRLVRDLFDHKEAIFGELKRQASNAAGPRIEAPRQRAVSSTDEGSRRAAMEARARAINEERQRAKSPGPGTRHRRDKSTDGSMGSGRFPVVASPRPDSVVGGRLANNKRTSLEVPGSASSSPIQTRHTPNDSGSSNDNTTTPPPSADGQTLENGAHQTQDAARSESPVEAIPDGEMPGAFTSGPHIAPPQDDNDDAQHVVENKSSVGSLKRNAGAGSGRRAPSGRYGSLKNRGNLNLTGAPDEPQGTPGVQLQDRAMDDDFS